MKSKLLALVGCLIVAMLLTGCLQSGGGSGSGSSGSSYTSGVSGDSGGSGDLGGGGNIPHTPEPATIALVGSGLAAYLLTKTRKKK